MERELLILKSAGGYLPSGGGPNQHLRELRRHGRVRISGERNTATSADILHDITDLGRLALRVCPVDEF